MFGKGFESIVNSDRCQTITSLKRTKPLFESIVNSDRCQTINGEELLDGLFESIVNSDRCQTKRKFRPRGY